MRAAKTQFLSIILIEKIYYLYLHGGTKVKMIKSFRLVKKLFKLLLPAEI